MPTHPPKSSGASPPAGFLAARTDGHLSYSAPGGGAPVGEAGPSDILPLVAQRLGEFSDSFSRLVRSLEDQFLPLGQHLAEVSGCLEKLARVADEGLTRMRHQLTGGTAGDLNTWKSTTSELLRKRLSDLNLGLASLRDVEGDLQTLRTLGEKVDACARFLKVCGTCFAVESARSAETSDAFAPFVTELRRLAATIGALAQRMEDRSAGTLGHLATAVDAFQKDLAELDGLAGVFAAAADEVQALLDNVTDTIAQIENSRNGIARHTDQIVHYLQLGDVVRQKCEHVLAGIGDACNTCMAAEDELARAGAARQILRMEAAQLARIRGDLSEAHDRLTRGYASLQGELEDFTRSSHRLQDGATFAGGGRMSPWDRLKERLEELSGLQQRERRITENATQMAGSVESITESLNTELQGIRSVNGDLHLLALNAMVQTAHLGHEGRTLSVLAQQVNELRQSCDRVVQNVVGVLDHAMARVRQVGGTAAPQTEIEHFGWERFGRVQAESRVLFQAMLALAGSAGENIRRSTGGLASLAGLSADIAAHHSHLEQILHGLPDDGDSFREEVDAQLLARYTMKSERDIHQLTQRANPQPPATHDAPSPPVANPGGDGLGDNVELF